MLYASESRSTGRKAKLGRSVFKPGLQRQKINVISDYLSVK
jgi:hypothetical protein